VLCVPIIFKRIWFLTLLFRYTWFKSRASDLFILNEIFPEIFYEFCNNTVNDTFQIFIRSQFMIILNLVRRSKYFKIASLKCLIFSQIYSLKSVIYKATNRNELIIKINMLILLNIWAAVLLASRFVISPLCQCESPHPSLSVCNQPTKFNESWHTRNTPCQWSPQNDVRFHFFQLVKKYGINANLWNGNR
jgi:hypothetical protein